MRKIGDTRSVIVNKAAQVKPSMRYDGNGNQLAWQKESRDKLLELLGLPLERCDDDMEVEYQTDCPDFKEIRFTFQSEEGYYVPCHLLIPHGTVKPQPTFICIQGHSTGMHISLGRVKYEKDANSIAHGDRDFAIRAVKEGFAAVTIEQRYMGECGCVAENGEPGCYYKKMTTPPLLYGRTAIGERVWDVQRLIDVLEKYFSDVVDCENIMCLGNSGGGTTTFYASCVDERIKLSIPSCCFSSYAGSIVNVYHCECNYIPNIAKYFDMGDLGGLIAPRKLILVSGKKDGIFPVEPAREQMDLIMSFYKQMDVQDNVYWIIGDEGHRFYADLAYDQVHAMLSK